MTLLIQDGPAPALRMEGRTGEIGLWPAAVAALKARTPAEQREWLLSRLEQFPSRDAVLLRDWLGQAAGGTAASTPPAAGQAAKSGDPTCERS